MPPVTDQETTPTAEDVLDLIERLGGIAPRRVLLRPVPGTATEADLLWQLDHCNRLCELVENTLVEKAMGVPEGNLAAWLIHLLYTFVAADDLGELFTPDTPFRLMGGLTRLPDVTFVRRENLPNGQTPTDAVTAIAPDLAIEVLSPNNTIGEMQRKRKEYFLAGTTLVWEVDPRRRVVTVYTAPDVSQTFTEKDTLDGGTVLPGLQLAVQRVFERLPAIPPVRRTRKKKSS